MFVYKILINLLMVISMINFCDIREICYEYFFFTIFFGCLLYKIGYKVFLLLLNYVNR